ncbi:hypothetical protein [Nostoc sp. FACHB-133]|uniref:hypothetical protein n=1 Tax=Nostoc sp. FACHB-133 TaxID=2692835 RepID=UPI001686D9DE|nr:hypothetical protein [Nostoc sp. FACHB-133]MBD2526235.1 hypothetical protein [Nostoc sp. FACHB-133]
MATSRGIFVLIIRRIESAIVCRQMTILETLRGSRVTLGRLQQPMKGRHLTGWAVVRFVWRCCLCYKDCRLELRSQWMVSQAMRELRLQIPTTQREPITKTWRGDEH